MPTLSLSKWGPRHYQKPPAHTGMCRGSHMRVLRAPHSSLPCGHHVGPCTQNLASSDWGQVLNWSSPTAVLGVGGVARRGTWDLRARNRPQTSCPDWGTCGKKMPEGGLGAEYLQASWAGRRQRSPSAPPNRAIVRDSAEAARLDEMEPCVRGRSSDLGKPWPLAGPFLWIFLMDMTSLKMQNNSVFKCQNKIQLCKTKSLLGRNQWTKDQKKNMEEWQNQKLLLGWNTRQTPDKIDHDKEMGCK